MRAALLLIAPVVLVVTLLADLSQPSLAAEEPPAYVPPAAPPAAPVQTATRPAETTPAPVRQPQTVATYAPAPVEVKPYVLPPESGLVMVETATDSARALQSEPAEAPPTAAAPRRARPPRPVMAEEPLVLVEPARKD